MLEFSDTIFEIRSFIYFVPAGNIYLLLVNDVAGDEKFEDSEESGVESDEAEDGDEDGPDRLHLVCQDGSSDSQTEDQQVDDLQK